MSRPEIPGYDVAGLLGRGSGGEVWLATELATGEQVAVKCLRPGAGLDARDRLRREAAVLAGVVHPHVVRLRTVAGCVGAPDDIALVLDFAPGGSLARLVARRGQLAPGEVVTVLVPLAEALDSVHRSGLVHGDVTPGNVLFAGDGRPVLGDLGVARLGGEAFGQEPAGTPGYRDPASRRAGPASDVHGLAATCFFAVTGHPPYDAAGRRPVPVVPRAAARLVEVLERALAPEGATRPDAAELARLAFEAAPAAPVRLLPLTLPDIDSDVEADLDQPLTVVSPRRPVVRAVAAAPAPRARSGAGRRRRPRATPAWLGWRAALTCLFGAVGVAMAALTGIAWAGSSHDPAPRNVVASVASAVPEPVPGSVDEPVRRGPDPPGPSRSGGWPALMAELDERRSVAFASGDARQLGRVYAEGSPAGRRDQQRMASLVAAGLRAEGLRLSVVQVSAVSRSAQSLRLSVVDRMPAYRLVDEAGRVVARRDGRGNKRWSVTMVREAGQWRVYEVARG